MKVTSIINMSTFSIHIVVTLELKCHDPPFLLGVVIIVNMLRLARTALALLSSLPVPGSSSGSPVCSAWLTSPLLTLACWICKFQSRMSRLTSDMVAECIRVPTPSHICSRRHISHTPPPRSYHSPPACPAGCCRGCRGRCMRAAQSLSHFPGSDWWYL